MNKYSILLLSILLVLKFTYGQNTEDVRFTRIGHEFKLESKILNQTKTLYIHLPFGYKSDKEYPLVLLLDHMAFKPLSSITEIMSYERSIPKSIVVSLVTYDTKNAYSPIINDISTMINGGKTMLFFEKELFPFLESKYKISTKILWGQGLSGTFSSFVMLTKPKLFDAYISNMPKMNLIDTTFDFNESIKKINQKDVFYFLTGNSQVETDKMTKRFIGRLESNKNPHLKWHYEEQSDSNFIAQIVNSYIYGIEKFFKK